MSNVWAVLSSPAAGRETAFNDWYDHIHLRDILRQPGAAAAQRFGLAEEQITAGGGARPSDSHRYLALYELFDPAGMTGVTDVIFSAAMRVSDAFDFTSAGGGFYSAHAMRDGRALPPGAGDIVVERVAEGAGPGFARWYADVRLPALAAVPGVASGLIASYSAVQILPVAPESHFLALYRLADRGAALADWARAPALPEGVTAEVACFTPLGSRLTVHDVLAPTEEAVAAEALAHAAMGERYYRAFPMPETA